MSALPEVQEESRIVGVPLPDRRIGRGHLHYGAFQIAASYCGLPAPPSGFVGEWQHGWIPSDTVDHPEVVTATDGLSRHKRATYSFLVARQDEEGFLREHGYRSAHAVGLPITYQPRQPVERLHGSLLVMPVHSLEYTSHKWNFEQYAAEIDAVRERFSSVVACVSPSCFRRGYWVDAFERRLIPVISGAEIFDANAYPRLASIFGRFEFVTTNGFGSHLVYSALFGAKPSIYGTIAPFRKTDFQHDAYYWHNPELLTLFLDLYTPEALRRRFPHLFVLPWEATDQYEWAAFETGMQCRRRPDELAHLLGWNATKSPAFALRNLTSRIARKAVAIAKRVADPAEYSKNATLSTLQQATPGQLVPSSLPLTGLSSLDGPRFAWALETYFYGSGSSVWVNPPDGPVLDLAPGEGATVLALAKHHPYRTIYYLQPASDQAVQLDHNLRTYPDAVSRIAPLRPSSELPATALCGLYEQSHWQTLSNEFRNVFSEVIVLRMHVGATCWKDAVSVLEDFPRCRLLLLECDDQPQDYFGLLLAELTNRHFVPRLDLLKFSSLQQPGLLSPKHILSLALTRSGLSIPSSEV